MKQQTAVEWLLENIHIIPKFKLSVQDTIDKAKQMEKEQIINAHGVRYSDITEETVKGVEYYNKTYNQDRITISETKRSIEGIGLNNQK